MDLLVWIGVGLLLYWAGLVLARRGGILPRSIKLIGPVMVIRTDRGRALIERLSRHRRFWRAWTNVGVGIALVVMVGSFVMLLTSAALSAVDPSPGRIQQPQNILVIPGVNEFLPLEVAPEIVAGLVIATVVHEGGHGLLCRVEGIEIESMGAAMLAVVPLGAFVEPDQEATERASRGARTRLFAAGVTNNFALTVVAFALLFGPVAGAIAVAPGAAVGGVLPGSAAEDAGIEAGDRITALDGAEVEDFEAFAARLEATSQREVSVRLNGETTATVRRSLLVTASTPSDLVGIPEGSTVLAVDGEQVWTVGGFEAAAGDRRVVEVTHRPRDGAAQIVDLPVGTLVTVRDGPVAAAGIDPGTVAVVTAIDGERILDRGDLQTVLDAREPGRTVPVELYRGGDLETVEVTLGESPTGGGFLGVTTAPGTSGLGLSDFGIRGYPADRYLAVLGGGDADDVPIPLADSFVGKVVLAVFLPLASIVLGAVLPYNFAGFTADVSNFFVVEGPLSALGGGTFLLANVLFWTGWININLGFFNCIPAVPLDGGHILRATLESVLSRLPFGVSDRVVGGIVTGVAVVMLASFVVLIFGAGMFAP